MDFKGIKLLCGMLSLGLLPAFSAQDLITELPIPLLESTELPSEPFYLTSGLPLSEGRVVGADDLRIRDKSGKVVPAQFTPLAYWPDGSIKWVSISPVLHPDTVFPLGLYWEQGESSTGEIQVEQNGQHVFVDNGLVSVEIAGGTWSVQEHASGESIHARLELDRIMREPAKVRSGWLAERKKAGAKRQHTYVSSSEATTVTVEESGPTRVVVRMQGRFTAEDGSEFNRYDCRIYVYSGSATVRWQPTWIFDGDPAADSIGRIEAAVSSDAFLPPDVEAVVGILADEGKQAFAKFKDYVVQDGVDSIRDPDGSQKARLAGWISLSKAGRAPINVAVKDFWQNYPSGFSLDHEELKVGLWPGVSDYILDLARSSDGTGDGERGADRDADATGVSKTFDLLLNIGSSTENFSRVAALFDLEPLFYPGSRYMTGTKVLGEMAYYDPRSFPSLEGFYKAATHWLLENQRHFNWYGFVDYGDVRTNFRHGSKKWETQGRYGWRHGSGDVPHAFMTQYFRTGDPVAWKVGAPYARHVLDVDTVHHAREDGKQPVGAMHRRGQDHWSGLVEAQYTYSQGAFLYHYLSGDLRARSVLLEEVAQWQSGPEAAVSANAANTCVRAWEATGDPQWLEAAKRQMGRHLNETTYDNFRFASDYVQVLTQYTRLTGDPKGEETIRRRTEILMDPKNWAYFHPEIGRRGGRLMLPAEMYHRTGDETQYIKHPSRLLASILPKRPPEEGAWNFDTLTSYMSSVSMNATTHLSELARGPYYLGALQKAGWTEERIRSLPRVYGTPHVGANMDGTYANVKQKMETYDNDWAYIDLPQTEGCTDGARNLAETLRGLPMGGVLYVNKIPFKLASPANREDGGILLLCEGKSLTIDVPDGTETLYLLGPMIEKGDWREGAAVVRYTLHFGNGETREGVWRNLLDLDDHRGLHYAIGAAPGRFWHLGERPRVHACVVKLDLKGKDVRSIAFENSGEGYRSFILGATAKLNTKETKPLMEVVFSPAKPDADKLVFDAGTPPADDRAEAGWLLSRSEISNLSFSPEGVSSDGLIALQFPLPDGEYLVDLSLATSSFRGGILQIGVSGNGFGLVAVSGLSGDRLCIPARVENGLLKLWANPVPAFYSSVHQKPRWTLKSVKIYPLPEGEWEFRPELPMKVIEGEPLGKYATFGQSVGAKPQYSFTGMDQLLASGNVYQVSPVNYPQDVIFEFKEPVEVTGLLFSPAEGYGPKGVILQVRHPGETEWQSVGEWKLEAGSAGILDSVPRQEIVAARLLMDEGHASKLIVNRADVFGVRRELK